MTTINTEMKVRAIAPWFGGKRTLAPKIVELLGKHTQYFEPFCGSMAVLLAKEPSKNETVNDLHGDLINLAKVIADPESAPTLYERLQSTLVAESLLDQAKHELEELTAVPEDGITSTMIDRAYWYFIASWMIRNGVSGMDRDSFQIAVRWTPNGGSPTVRWRSAVASIPAWHERLRNVVILSRDAFRMLLQIPDRHDTVIYCDPPYAKSSRSHGNYKHDFQRLDHHRLAETLTRFCETRVMVSYYDCDDVRELYAGWNFIGCTANKNLHNQNGRGARKKEAPEVLITNF